MQLRTPGEQKGEIHDKKLYKIIILFLNILSILHYIFGRFDILAPPVVRPKIHSASWEEVDILGLVTIGSHHHSINSHEPIRFLQTSQNRLINIHRESLKHISQSALFGFGKNIGHDQI